MLWFPCRNCHVTLSADESATGEAHTCARCGHVTRVPAASLPPLSGGPLGPHEADDDRAEALVRFRRGLRAEFGGEIPAEVKALGELDYFGASRKPPVWVLVLTAGPPLVVGAALLAWLGLFLAGAAQRIASDPGGWTCWGFSLLGGPAGILIAWQLWRRWSRRGTLCAALGTGGLVCRCHGELVTYSWADLHEAWLCIEPPSPFLNAVLLGDAHQIRRFRWLMADGREIVLPPELPDLDLVGPLLRRRLLRHRLPALAARLAAGETVTFGALLHLEPNGLVCRRTLLVWDELDEILVEENEVEVFARGLPHPWHTVPAAEVPNVALLIALANGTAERRREAPRK
jgi:hypothetical protein